LTALPLVHRIRHAWPSLRAGLVTVHCLAVAVAAVPRLTQMRPLLASDPQTAFEIHPWAQLFGVSDETFGREAEALRSGWANAQQRATAPFDAYLSFFGAHQPWGMFACPNRSPTRFSVEVLPQRGCVWI
jgi:hypothetical protein